MSDDEMERARAWSEEQQAGEPDAPMSIAAQVGCTLVTVQALLRRNAELEGRIEDLERRLRRMEIKGWRETE